MIAEAIEDVYYSALNDLTKKLNGVSIWQLIAHINNNYAQTSQPEKDTNMADFHPGVDSALPLAVHTLKQERCLGSSNGNYQHQCGHAMWWHDSLG